MDCVTTSGPGSSICCLASRAGSVSPWRDLPERFGGGVKVHRRFTRWAKWGLWRRVFAHLASEADNEYAMIDGTTVRAHQHSAGASKKLGRQNKRVPDRPVGVPLLE